MKNGIYAVYKGKEYSADYFSGKGILLRSNNIDDLNLGFQRYDQDEDILCFKFVDKAELDEFYRARTMAKYKGFDFEVIKERDDMISIATMKGDYRKWIELGMTQIDQGVYQKWINKEDAEIRVEKEEL